VNVLEHLGRGPLPRTASWDEVRLRGDAAALQRARAFMTANDLPARALPAASLRELWCLLFSYGELFLRLL